MNLSTFLQTLIGENFWWEKWVQKQWWLAVSEHIELHFKNAGEWDEDDQCFQLWWILMYNFLLVNRIAPWVWFISRFLQNDSKMFFFKLKNMTKAWHSHCRCYQTNNISFKEVILTICNYSFFQMSETKEQPNQIISNFPK